MKKKNVLVVDDSAFMRRYLKQMIESDPSLKTETIRLFEQTVCSRRQLTFELYRNNTTKIGMNTAASKFYHIWWYIRTPS